MTFKTQVYVRYGIWLFLSAVVSMGIVAVAWVLMDAFCAVFFSSAYAMTYKVTLLKWIAVVVVFGSIAVGQAIMTVYKGGWDVVASRLGAMELKTLGERLIVIAKEKEKRDDAC